MENTITNSSIIFLSNSKRKYPTHPTLPKNISFLKEDLEEEENKIYKLNDHQQSTLRGFRKRVANWINDHYPTLSE